MPHKNDTRQRFFDCKLKSTNTNHPKGADQYQTQRDLHCNGKIPVLEKFSAAHERCVIGPLESLYKSRKHMDRAATGRLKARLRPRLRRRGGQKGNVLPDFLIDTQAKGMGAAVMARDARMLAAYFLAVKGVGVG